MVTRLRMRKTARRNTIHCSRRRGQRTVRMPFCRILQQFERCNQCFLTRSPLHFCHEPCTQIHYDSYLSLQGSKKQWLVPDRRAYAVSIVRLSRPPQEHPTGQLPQTTSTMASVPQILT